MSISDKQRFEFRLIFYANLFAVRHLVAICALLLYNMDNAVDAGSRRRGLQFKLDQIAEKSGGTVDSHHWTFAEAGWLHRTEIGPVHSGDIRKGTQKI